MCTGRSKTNILKAYKRPSTILNFTKTMCFFKTIKENWYWFIFHGLFPTWSPEVQVHWYCDVHCADHNRIWQILQFLKKSSAPKKYQLSPFFDRAQQQGNAKQSKLIWSVCCSISRKWRGHYGTWADMGLSWLHEMKNDSGFKGVDGQEVLQG